jgi:hypothetical protein
MSLTLHTATVPVFTRTLGNALSWLDKAQAHAEARKFSPDNYLALRLAPDMLPFSRQIQIASDTAKGAVARLADIEIPKWEDTEATLDELRARLHKTLDFIASAPAAGFDGAETREIVIPTRVAGPRHFTGASFLTDFALPNFYFHTTTAYALLRQAGVELGKMDFLGKVG